MKKSLQIATLVYTIGMGAALLTPMSSAVRANAVLSVMILAGLVFLGLVRLERRKRDAKA